ncbi:hypothetical protein F3Y22_tig00112383pilonHSYRG00268 [Hibiscus syriacus]|uniref:Uncharacterized protein n=1 Tax=Hibiscus syriacus TaxID=106335 RepID=A0A6A2X041_HIBSY|nr:hypothetical protein F3Y22_tig00112383pilonHSYRG00268 [Hibiscus syriacus]
MESMGGKIIGGAYDFKIEVETQKQPKGGYMYFYMTECKRMKEGGEHIGSVRNDVLEKCNSMSDAEKEPYIAQSKIDSEEYKEWRKEHEKKEVSTRCNIKRVNLLIKHLKEKGQLNVLREMGFGSLVGVRDRPTRRELCRSLMAQFDVKQCIAKYGDFSFPLGILCAAAVLGVGNEGKSVVEVSKSKNWKALASKYGLKQKARVLLYLVGIFLCPTGDTSTNKDYMKLICNEGLKGEFNWVEYVHSRLIKSIITFKNGSQRYLKGCIAILEVALFNFWSGCEAVPAYERTGVTRIRAWGEGREEAVEAEDKEEEIVVLGDDSEGKQTSIPKMAPKRQLQKHDLSQSSSQPRSSQPQPHSQTIASSEKISWKRVKEVGLDQEREEMDPIGHEDDQPIGDAMMEEAPVGEDVTIKTVMEYMVNFREHIDSLMSGICEQDQANCKTYDNVTYCKDLNDVWNTFPYFNDLNTLLVDDSTEKMIYNPKYNYICPHSFDDASHSDENALEKDGNIREYLENLLKALNVPDFVRNNPF